MMTWKPNSKHVIMSNTFISYDVTVKKSFLLEDMLVSAHIKGNEQ